MSQVQVLVQARKNDSWSSDVRNFKPPVSVSASRGFGTVTGDTEITWHIDMHDYDASDEMPKWLDNDGRMCVYIARGDVDTTSNEHFVNAYYVESVDIKKELKRFIWRIRGRDAMQVLLNQRISCNFRKDEEITVR